MPYVFGTHLVDWVLLAFVIAVCIICRWSGK